MSNNQRLFHPTRNGPNVAMENHISRQGQNAKGEAATAVPVKSTRPVAFPRCDVAVRKMGRDEWELADAIVDECSETGEDGVRNGSRAKIEAMQKEIAQNHDADLSMERIRKLRQVASAFPAGRRRSGVSLEAHLEAGTPDALEKILNAAPKGTALTREYIRRSKIRPRRQGRASTKTSAVIRSGIGTKRCKESAADWNVKTNS